MNAMSPHELREEADRLRRQEAELRAMAHAFQRESDKKALAALIVEDRLRGSSLPPPSLIAVDAPSATALTRSVDPDAVEHAAIERTEAVQDQRVARRAANAHRGNKEARHALIRGAWIEERTRHTDDEDLKSADKAVADKFKVSKKTVERATKELRACIAK
jgi:hypothetical protein